MTLNERYENVDICVNIADDHQCKGNKVTITKKFLKESTVLMIFCSQHRCAITTNNNPF